MIHLFHCYLKLNIEFSFLFQCDIESDGDKVRLNILEHYVDKIKCSWRQISYFSI